MRPEHGASFAGMVAGHPPEALVRGVPPSRVKRAFHRASLSLHPDRLVSFPTERRAEATEVFKALSAAYDTELQSVAGELVA